MKSGKTVLGIIAAFAKGALVGILYAPEKGSKTRKKIARKGEDYLDNLTEKYSEIKDEVAHKYQDTKAEVETYLNKGKTKLADLTKQGGNNLS